MPVVTFAVSGAGNCVVVDGDPLVYATVDGRGFVMRARCPHRGGPLHLSTPTADGAYLVCPWHERKTSVARLRAQIPAVRRGDRVAAVIADAAAPGAAPRPPGPDDPISVEYRPLSPELARPRATG
jgi:hypothetical protein